MKKKIIIGVCIFLGLILVSGLGFLTAYLLDPRFKLEERYYSGSSYLNLDENTLNNLIKKEESFVVFVYQPMCAASSTLEGVIDEFLETYTVNFYKIQFSDMKETVLGDTVSYYPSVVIYEKGKVVDYLDANSGEDTDIYKNVDKFTEWFKSYVKVNKKEKKDKTTKVYKIDYDYKIDAEIDSLVYDENKVNVYFFWGNGCPHCALEHKFFDRIKKECGDYFVLNDFEVWYDENNRELLKEFAKKMGREVEGIPFTIIGEEVFVGFDPTAEDLMINAILSQYKNSFDAYFTYAE